MNRKKMILAVSVQLRSLYPDLLTSCADDLAAAVLDLCGPEPLGWVYPSDGSAHDVDCRYEVALDGKYWRLVKGVTGGGAYIGHFPDRAAAQAAAQAHATTAHWENTPLGKMMGVK